MLAAYGAATSPQLGESPGMGGVEQSAQDGLSKSRVVEFVRV